MIRSLILILALAIAPPATAQPVRATRVTLDQFLARVARGNLGLIAERANVSIADAQIAVARMFPDPQLTVGVSGIDLARTGAPLTTSIGVAATWERGGKRGARIEAARSDRAEAGSTLDDVARTVRADAADAFVDALAARLVLDRKTKTLDSLGKLVAANDQRHRAGDIGEVPVTQARVERERFHGEVLIAGADVRDADLRLALFAGSTDDVLEPTGALHTTPRAFDANALIRQARADRPDVVAARIASSGARYRITLARAHRAVDVSGSLGVGRSTAATTGTSYGAIAPTPPVTTLDLSLSIPLPLSHVYRGELDAAIATARQTDTKLATAQLTVEIEVRQALARYDATVAQVRLYTGGILGDADKVLESMTYNYQRGGTTLLEVLEAQRTVDEIYLAYYQALADHAHALIAVERAAGIWDIKL